MTARKINWAITEKYGIALKIERNVIFAGEQSPYVEFETLQDALAYIANNTLMVVGSDLPAHMIIPDKENLLAWCEDNGIEVDETKSIEEIRKEITNYYETTD